MSDKKRDESGSAERSRGDNRQRSLSLFCHWTVAFLASLRRLRIMHNGHDQLSAARTNAHEQNCAKDLKFLKHPSARMFCCGRAAMQSARANCTRDPWGMCGNENLCKVDTRTHAAPCIDNAARSYVGVARNLGKTRPGPKVLQYQPLGMSGGWHAVYHSWTPRPRVHWPGKNQWWVDKMACNSCFASVPTLWLDICTHRAP